MNQAFRLFKPDSRAIVRSRSASLLEASERRMTRHRNQQPRFNNAHRLASIEQALPRRPSVDSLDSCQSCKFISKKGSTSSETSLQESMNSSGSGISGHPIYHDHVDPVTGIPLAPEKLARLFKTAMRKLNAEWAND